MQIRIIDILRVPALLRGSYPSSATPPLVYEKKQVLIMNFRRYDIPRFPSPVMSAQGLYQVCLIAFNASDTSLTYALLFPYTYVFGFRIDLILASRL